MANFEIGHSVISSSINLLFLKIEPCGFKVIVLKKFINIAFDNISLILMKNCSFSRESPQRIHSVACFRWEKLFHSSEIMHYFPRKYKHLSRLFYLVGGAQFPFSTSFAYYLTCIHSGLDRIWMKRNKKYYFLPII